MPRRKQTPKPEGTFLTEEQYGKLQDSLNRRDEIAKELNSVEKDKEIVTLKARVLELEKELLLIKYGKDAEIMQLKSRMTSIEQKYQKDLSDISKDLGVDLRGKTINEVTLEVTD
jgi:hypothetical protein